MAVNGTNESNANTVRPERVINVLMKIQDIAKSSPGITIDEFKNTFLKTKAWMDLNKTEKKLIWSQKDVLAALDPIVNNGVIKNAKIVAGNDGSFSVIYDLQKSTDDDSAQEVGIGITTDDKNDEGSIRDMFENNNGVNLMGETATKDELVQVVTGEEDNEVLDENDTKVFMVSDMKMHDLTESEGQSAEDQNSELAVLNAKFKIKPNTEAEKEAARPLTFMERMKTVATKSVDNIGALIASYKIPAEEQEKIESEEKQKRDDEIKKCLAELLEGDKESTEKLLKLYVDTKDGKQIDFTEINDEHLLVLANSIAKVMTKYNLKENDLADYLVQVVEGEGTKVDRSSLPKLDTVEKNIVARTLKSMTGQKPQVNKPRNIFDIGIATTNQAFACLK